MYVHVALHGWKLHVTCTCLSMVERKQLDDPILHRMCDIVGAICQWRHHLRLVMSRGCDITFKPLLFETT